MKCGGAAVHPTGRRARAAHYSSQALARPSQHSSQSAYHWTHTTMHDERKSPDSYLCFAYPETHPITRLPSTPPADRTQREPLHRPPQTTYPPTQLRLPPLHPPAILHQRSTRPLPPRPPGLRHQQLRLRRPPLHHHQPEPSPTRATRSPESRGVEEGARMGEGDPGEGSG